MSASAGHDDLHERAKIFADELNERVSRVLPGPLPLFLAQVSPDKREGEIRVFISPVEHDDDVPMVAPLPLTAGKHMLHLRVRFECCWDTAGRYLSIEESKFSVGVRDRPDPLFRYEYDRSRGDVLPSAHLHVHAHRDELTYLLAAGDKNRPKERKALERGRVPLISEIHFPQGGHRFRPCLEDVLAMVIDEFGVTTLNGWRNELREGRVAWRRLQLRAAVRDAPEDAADVLRNLGYTVECTKPPGENKSRLEAL